MAWPGPCLACIGPHVVVLCGVCRGAGLLDTSLLGDYPSPQIFANAVGEDFDDGASSFLSFVAPGLIEDELIGNGTVGLPLILPPILTTEVALEAAIPNLNVTEDGAPAVSLANKVDSEFGILDTMLNIDSLQVGNTMDV